MVKEDNKIEVVKKGEGYIDAEYKEPSPSTDFEYKIEGENVIITRYIGNDTVVNIPETIEGKNVTELDGAFAMKNLQSVKIPNTVKTIGHFTFWKNQLTYINIPKSVTKIEYGAFSDNKIIEEQAYIYDRTSTGEEDRTTLIGYGGNKKEITIPETVKTIAFCAMNDTPSIESVIIGNNVTSIELSAFSCPNLKKVVIGENVTNLGLMAFSTCYNLIDVEFRGDVPNFAYVGSGDTSGSGDGSVSGTISVTSGYTFAYNENLKIKVPKGKLQDYKTATVTLNGEVYYDSIDTWFSSISLWGVERNESLLNVFYE